MFLYEYKNNKNGNTILVAVPFVVGQYNAVGVYNNAQNHSLVVLVLETLMTVLNNDKVMTIG